MSNNDLRPTDDLYTLQLYCGTWSKATFPESTSSSVLAHLREEMIELAEEVDPVRRREECADVLILMLDLAHYEGWDLWAALSAKHEKNRARKWGPPDANGVSHHVKE